MISVKPAEGFCSVDSGKKCWFISYFENVFPLQQYIFCLITNIGSRALLTLPTFSVNCIISIIIIYNYNHSRKCLPSKYCFENFIPIIFRCVDCPITSFYVSWRRYWQSPQYSHIYDCNIFGAINTFQIHFLQYLIFLTLSYCPVGVEYR